MPRREVFGRCHICGDYGKLSFEHVPPEKAFNNKRTIKTEFENFIGAGPNEILNGEIQQRGIGDFTLCERCNSETGSWYAKDFIEWCYQGFDILLRSGGAPTLFYLNRLYPLRIIKQILSMFFSINGPGLGDNNPVLVKFIKNKVMNTLPPKFRFFVYYNNSLRMRYAGFTARLDINTQKREIFSEFNYPPYGYVMTIDSGPPDLRLIEITHFSVYKYGHRIEQYMKIPVLETNLWFPGDYRTKDQIEEDMKKNREYLEDEGMNHIKK